MFRSLCLACLLSGAPLAAEEWRTLGARSVITNDWIGDGLDRGRSAAYQLSYVTGPELWTEALPARPWNLLEWRLRAEIREPGEGGAWLPYAASVSAAVTGHFAAGPFEISLGVEGTAMGPQTGLSDLHENWHDRFSLPAPQGVDDQISDAVYFGLLGEVVWPVTLGRAEIRPFVAARSGVETWGRVGADVLFGSLSRSMLLRDEVTGQIVPGITGAGAGPSLVLGADWTWFEDSAYLPADRVTALDERWRARAGLHWQMAPGWRSMFYGVTWVSPEFEEQDEGGQLLGSVSFDIRF